MDKLKSILNPGSKKDDEVMYGSGNPDDPVHSGTTGTRSGQGSHFASSRTGGNDSLSSSTNPTSTTGHGSSTTNDPFSSTNPTSSTGYGSSTTKDPLSTSTNPTGTSQYDTGSTGQGTHGLNEPYASRMPGGFDDDAATTASVSSGVPGHSQSRSGITGTNDPVLDKPLPREPASAGTGLMGSSGNNTTGTGSSLTGKEYPNRSVGSSGVGDQNYAPDTGRSFPLGGSSNTTSGSNYPSGQTGTYPAGGTGGSTTAGPHSSNLANKADPRVDSDLDGSRTTGNTGLGSGTGPTVSSTSQGSLGRDTALASGTGAGAGMTSGTGTGSGLTSGTGTGSGLTSGIGTGSGLTSGTGTGSGLTSGTGTRSGLTSGTGSGTGMTSGTSGYGPDSWRHDHTGHGHQYEGDPCATGEVAPTGALHTAGPHVTDTANRLDPHVGSDGTTTGSTGHHHGHHGGDAALAGAGVGAGTGTYESSRDTRSGNTGSGLGSSTSDTTETSSTGKTAGPHKSDLLNKLDPRVDSDLSKQRDSTGTTGTGLGSSTTGNTGTSGHHYGRDAGLAGAGGAVAYEAEKHHRGNEPTGTNSGLGSTSTTSGLGHTGSTSGMGSTGTTSGLDSTGTSSGLGSSDPYGSSSTGSTGHTSGMASSNPYSSSSGLDPRVDSSRSGYDGTTDTTGSGKGHHLGRDAALGAGAGGLAYEAERAHGKPTQSSTMPSNTTGSAYDNTRGPTGSNYDHAGTALAGSGHQPITGTSGTSEYDRTQPQTSSHHHLGRDAAVGAGAGGVGYEAQKLHDTGRTDPGTQVREQTHPGASIATYPSPGYGHEGAQDPTHGAGHHHGHRKEDAAIAGGAGAGAGALAGHELSKKDEKHLEKEHSKELKAHEKERAKHEKAIEKDEKRHEKAEDKHEKKHGGLLGFLHHDKSHKDHATDHRDLTEERSAGTGTFSTTGLEGEHGSQSGVHDTPSSDGIIMGSGITTHDAYGTQEGHNKLHKDPPAKVLESRGLDHSGSGSGY